MAVSPLSSAEQAAFPPGLLLVLLGLAEEQRALALRGLFAAAGLPLPVSTSGRRGGKEPISTGGK